MSKPNENVSSKSAAAAFDCIRKADELLQSAASENDELTQKVASFEEGDKEFQDRLMASINKLASLKVADGDTVINETQKTAWEEYINAPESRKVAAVHLIDSLIEKYIEPAAGEGALKQAADLGEAAEMPGQPSSAEQNGPSLPTARY